MRHEESRDSILPVLRELSIYFLAPYISDLIFPWVSSVSSDGRYGAHFISTWPQAQGAPVGGWVGAVGRRSVLESYSSSEWLGNNAMCAEMAVTYMSTPP